MVYGKVLTFWVNCIKVDASLTLKSAKPKQVSLSELNGNVILWAFCHFGLVLFSYLLFFIVSCQQQCTQ